MTRRHSLLLLLPLLVAVAALQSWADRSTSVTFDELVLTGVGVRGLQTGDWRMVVDQPPLMPVLYGAAAGLFIHRLPDESVAARGFDDRWRWGRELYFGSGNDPRAVASASRAVGMVSTALLLLLVWGLGTAAIGPSAGLLAATLTGLHPEVISHGAVAYNDLPMALAFLAFLWTADRAVRSGCPKQAALAGLVLALAFGVKYSAIACLPVGGALLALEGWRRRKDRGWWRRIAVATLALAAAFWGATMLLYGGDWSLSGLRLGFWITVQRALAGHPAPAWLFGATSEDGFRLFFPLAGLVKTPVAMLALIGVGVAMWVRAGVAGAARVRGGWGGESEGDTGDDSGDDSGAGGRLARLAASPLRAPAIGLLVFTAFLMRSSQNVGFRYALPVLPLLALLAAAGWASGRAAGAVTGTAPGSTSTATGRSEGMPPGLGRRRGLLVALLALSALSVVRAGPFFLSYTSEWTALRSGPPALLDSSVDWGQGLVDLRRWMRENDVDAVNLSAFGSSVPEGYGIEYVPLPSFLSLRPTPTDRVRTPPRWTAIARTNLWGLYFDGDPFVRYREREPEAIVGGSILLFREPDPPTAAPAPGSQPTLPTRTPDAR